MLFRSAMKAIESFKNIDIKDIGKKASEAGTAISNAVTPKAVASAGGAIASPAGASAPEPYQLVHTKKGGVKFRDSATGKFVSQKQAMPSLFDSALTGATTAEVGMQDSRVHPQQRVGRQTLLGKMGTKISETGTKLQTGAINAGKNVGKTAFKAVDNVGASVMDMGEAFGKTGVGKIFKEIAFQLSPITNFFMTILPKTIPLFMGLASKMMIVATVLAADRKSVV